MQVEKSPGCKMEDHRGKYMHECSVSSAYGALYRPASSHQPSPNASCERLSIPCTLRLIRRPWNARSLKERSKRDRRRRGMSKCVLTAPTCWMLLYMCRLVLIDDSTHLLQATTFVPSAMTPCMYCWWCTAGRLPSWPTTGQTSCPYSRQQQTACGDRWQWSGSSSGRHSRCVVCCLVVAEPGVGVGSSICSHQLNMHFCMFKVVAVASLQVVQLRLLLAAPPPICPPQHNTCSIIVHST
jgi:hypothetical protein